jgi:hypothetical protein
MTWYADELLLRATPNALAAVRNSRTLAPFAYHVRSVDDHAWFKPEVVHRLPQEGLIVVRPICGPESHDVGWYGEPVLKWSELTPASADVSALNEGINAQLSAYLDEDSQPSIAFRSALAEFAKQLQEPVVYYACGMWGGDIEYEYALVYNPDESLLATKPTLPPDRDGLEDSLRAALGALSLELPTGYFALHTRAFPWESHKLGSTEQR